MAFLRFKRRVWVELGPGGTDAELLMLYRRHRALCAQERAKQGAILSAAFEEAERGYALGRLRRSVT